MMSDKDNDSLNYRTIRARVEQRYNQRTEFFVHLGLFIFSMGAFTLINFAVYDHWVIQVLYWLTVLGWGGGLVAHGIKVLLETYIWENAKQRAIQREIELELWHREGQIPSFVQKPKRDASPQRLRMMSDGEVIIEDEESSSAYPSRR
jgi:hypothetical protein